MEDDKLFELVTKMYGDMQNEFEKIKNEMEEGFTGVNERIDKLEDKVTIIENDHGKKLDVLLDC